MTLSKNLRFTSSFTDELPADIETENYTRQVKNAVFSFVKPYIFENPKLIIASKEMLQELDINDANSKDFLNIFSGKKLLPNMNPYAMAYAGHQFGQWAGQLGDGRAINLGELKGKTNTWQVQLKGAGATPYSRNGDGFAVLRSSIREFLISEAMHYLSIASTRALCLIETGENVPRDKLYNGNIAYEKGALVCRVSPSFIRFGNFELLAARQDLKSLKLLTDYTIKHHFSNLLEIKNEKERYIEFVRTVSRNTQKMVVNWMRVGFVHAVMNTDNMSILGETIDYGPYGWIDNYDRAWTPNTTDKHERRYRFGNQINVAHWNLMQLANAIFPLINELQSLQEILDNYQKDVSIAFYKMQFEKLGLYTKNIEDKLFIDELLNLLESCEIDMTIFYRNLADFTHYNSFYKKLSDYSYEPNIVENNKEKWQNWLKQYQNFIEDEGLNHNVRKEKMNAINPKYVLRNYMVQQAIEQAEKEDYSLIFELHELLKNPYAEQKDRGKWFAKRPDWALDKFGCSTLSCSS